MTVDQAVYHDNNIDLVPRKLMDARKFVDPRSNSDKSIYNSILKLLVHSSSALHRILLHCTRNQMKTTLLVPEFLHLGNRS